MRQLCRMKTLPVTALACALMALSSATALLPAPDEDQADSEDTALFKRWSCPSGWTQIGENCFRFVKRARTWAEAERDCLSKGANLASIHNACDYRDVQRLIKTAAGTDKEAWVGGSDAQQNGFWFWSDGTKFDFSSWCPGEPNNGAGRGQDCLQINYSGRKCWDDDGCSRKKPYVCAMAPK